MKQTLQVEHCEHVSGRSFDEVWSAFQAATGSVEEGFDKVAGQAKGSEEFARIFKAREGSSGFMRFLTVDHGAWLANYGRGVKGVMVVLGNPLIAITMLNHDFGAGLNVPVRIYIYEGEDGLTRVAYDLPSNLMSGLGNADVTDAARKLDAKLVALAEQVSGTKA